MSANIKRSDRVPVDALLNEIAVAANLHADARALHFTMEPVDSRMIVDADPQLLTSALMNLLGNAFKFTHVGGRVALRALRDEGRVRIEVEDQCGGIPEGLADPFKPFAERRKHDRTGLGLGLSIARKAVRMHGGDVTYRNLPGVGCIFVIDLPLAVEEAVV
jgi:signal transduction histidine kinase